MPALLQLFAALGGCLDGRGDKPVIPAEQVYLDSPDQILPAGVVGQPYEAALSVSGGEPPYVWAELPETGLPTGLALTTHGSIAGVPAEAGDFVFSLLATDSAGRAKRSQVSLQIVLQPRVVSCGEKVDGRFEGNGFGFEGPDLTALESLEWLAVELPNELVTRIELVFDSRAISTLYVERPAEILGSSNVDDHYVPFYLNPGYTDMTVVLDAGTEPSLTGYLAQTAVPLLLVAQSPGDWSLDVVCTDGPIFVQLEQYPTELGLPITTDYDVYGENDDVRIWTEDPLPDWVSWDEATGILSGTAMEPGAWEFTIIAETADGRRREERSNLGVFDVTDVACGETVPLVVTEGYFDGDFYAFYDPNGYDVFRLPLQDVPASRVSLVLSGSEGHYLGLAAPEPEWMNFYGGAERIYVNEPTVTLDVTPETYPSLQHYVETRELYFSGGTIGLDTSMEVTVVCDLGPRPDLAALPVVQPLAEVSYPLAAIGGSAPYAWSADGLPSGIELTPGGTLQGQTGAIGTFEVELTVTDKFGASSTDTWTLYVGNDEACGSERQILCGDSIDGTFTESYYNDGNGPASTEVFCIVDDSDENLGFEIYSDDGELRVDVADPGKTADDMFTLDQGTYVAWVRRDSSEGVPVDPYSWPDIDDYANLPVLLSVRAYEPGDWTVHLVCE
jgi:hypothetical protein